MNEHIRSASVSATSGQLSVHGSASTSPPLKLVLGIAMLLAASGLLLLVLPFPSHTRFWSSLQNAGHSLLFTLLALSTCLLKDWLVQPRSSPPLRHRVWSAGHYLRPAVLLVGFGAGIELVQSTIGRDASVGDIALDVAGIVSGLLIHIGTATGLHRRQRAMLLGIALAILTGCFQLPLRYAIGNLCRPAWPVLADFDHCLAIDTVAASEHTTIRVVAAPAAWQANRTSVLRMKLEPGFYPGVRLVGMPRDWRGASALSLRLFNPGDRVIEAILRIHDGQHDQRTEDRFNRSLHLVPGENLIRLPLEAIASMNETATRRMDTGNVAEMVLFVHHNTTPACLYLDDITLSPVTAG